MKRWLNQNWLFTEIIKVIQKIIAFFRIISVKQKENGLFRKTASSSLIQNFELYVAMIENGADRNDLEAVFQMPYAQLTAQFTHLIEPYRNMIAYISEIELYTFIIAKKQFQKKIRDTIIKIITYPMVLSLALYFILFIFQFIIIPGLYDLILLFEEHTGPLEFVSGLITIVLLIGLILVIITFTLIYQYQKDKYRFYQNVFTLSSNNLYVNFVTYRFNIYYLILSKQGIPSKLIYQVLSMMPKDPCISQIAAFIHHKLNDGMDFLQINSELPLSKQYKHFFRTGIATGKTNQLLNKFQMLQETQLVRRIQAMARKLQIGIYLLIGLLVVMLYQLLLLPLRGLT